MLVVAEERYRFSGGSLYWSRSTGGTEAQEAVTWYSTEEQTASLERSLGVLRFEWLLPGCRRLAVSEASLSVATWWATRLVGVGAASWRARPAEGVRSGAMCEIVQNRCKIEETPTWQSASRRG